MSTTEAAAIHPIGVVVRRTGLSQHVIRVWEKRYEAVVPWRSDSNRRLYSEADVTRLNLLKRLLDEGHRIGQIALHPTDELERLIQQAAVAPPAGRARTEAIAREAVESAFKEVMALDAEALENELGKAAMHLGISGTLHRVVVPLVIRIGQEWATGDLLIAQEHVASHVIRDFLGSNTKPFAAPSNAPELHVATPLGQLHELGAILVSSAARIMGWRVTFLGASMPAPDIAAAVALRQPRALAISIVFPADDPTIRKEIATLSTLLPKEVTVFYGGRAAASYADIIEKAGARLLGDLRSFQTMLGQLEDSAD